MRVMTLFFSLFLLSPSIWCMANPIDPASGPGVRPKYIEDFNNLENFFEAIGEPIKMSGACRNIFSAVHLYRPMKATDSRVIRWIKDLPIQNWQRWRHLYTYDEHRHFPYSNPRNRMNVPLSELYDFDDILGWARAPRREIRKALLEDERFARFILASYLLTHKK